jgi:hypothetical protein
MPWRNILKKAGKEIYKATPLDNVVNIANEFQKPGGPNWASIGKNVAGGAFDTAAMFVPAARLGKVAKVATTAGFGSTSPFRNVLANAGWNTVGNMAFRPGSPAMLSSVAGSTPMTSAADFRMAESGNRAAGVPDYNTTAPATGTGGGVATGKVGAPPKELLALQAALQQQFDAQRIGQQSQYEQMVNQIARARTGGSLAAQSDLRSAGMSGRGQQLDLGSYLAESGYGSSPAMDVGRQYIQSQEAAQRGGILQRRAGEVAGLAEQELSAKDQLRRALDYLRQQETTARAQASMAAMGNLYGGSR